ncbi:MAG TPA: SRPBCC domain-containing protein [Thermomicrobiales bacterium]|jgi:uncharacterized protein YndB with AHSA1/START domain|nr:SRPBCC domain-containing protein [Thermomicrobiales bacterium]
MTDTVQMLNIDIVHRTRIRRPIADVYDALTTGPGFDGWFTAGSEIDARQGGSYTFRWREDGPYPATAELSGPVLEADRPARYAFQWNHHLDHPTTVAFDLTQDGAITTVTVTETGYPDTPAGRWQVMDCAVGWGEALTLLKFWLEHGTRYQ